MSLTGSLPFGISKPRERVEKQDHVMKAAYSVPAPRLYPARYFDASPTWNQWNRLTAADVHALRKEAGFEGQNVYFHLNHPIRFVRLVGVVVDIDQVANGKYTLVTVDDGSSQCIITKIVRRELAKGDNADYPSNTTIDNLDVHVVMGIPIIFVGSQRVDVGSLIKVKGTISTFRGLRQLELKRIFTMEDTNAEVQAWAEIAAYKRDVLSSPWSLSAAEIDAMDQKLRREERREQSRAKKKRDYNAKHEQKRRRHLEKYEAKRLAEEKKFNAGALEGSNNILAPWN